MSWPSGELAWTLTLDEFGGGSNPTVFIFFFDVNLTVAGENYKFHFFSRGVVAQR